MGNVIQAGNGQNPARQAALNGGLAGHGRGAHDQQGLRLGAEGGDARGPGDRDRRHRDRGRRRHGVDEQHAVPAAARPRRAADGQRPADRLDDQRRPLVLVRELPHGDGGRARRRELQGRPRPSRTPTRPRATARRRRRRAKAGSRTRSCRSPSRSARATRSSSIATKPSAKTRRPKRSARSRRRSRRRRHRHGGQCAGRERRRRRAWW